MSDKNEVPEISKTEGTAKQKEGTSGLAVAGLVVGIVAIIGSWIPFLNLGSAWIAVIAIGLSIAGIVITRKGPKGGKGVAIAGLVLGIITIIVVVVMYGAAGAASDDATDAAADAAKETAKAEEPAKKKIGATDKESGIVIGDSELGKDYEGKKTIIVNYEWTNNTDEAASLMWSYDIKAYQNGVELTESIFAEDWLTDKEDSGWVDSSKEVKPGATINTSIAYELSDESAPVDIEIKELFGSDAIAKKTLTIK